MKETRVSIFNLRNRFLMFLIFFLFAELLPATLLAETSQSCGSLKLKYERIDKDTILVIEGFAYSKDYTLRSNHIIEIKDIVGGSLIIPAEGSSSLLGVPNDAINVTWEFIKPGIILIRNGCCFESGIKGATISFEKRGVLIKGFKIYNSKK